MIKKLLFCLVFLGFFTADAETIKTDVLVIGGSASGLAAAIQSARSKLKTVLIMPGAWLNGNMASAGSVIVEAGGDLPSGIWGEFRKKVWEHYKSTAGFDTASNAPLRFEPFEGAAILKQITDSVKNLTLLTNTPYNSIKKDGTGWEVTIIENGKTETIRAKVLVDATENGEVVEKAGARFNNAIYANNNDEDLKLYRTSIASGEEWPVTNLNKIDRYNYLPSPEYYIALNAVIIKDADNLLVTEKLIPGNKNLQYLPQQLTLGQGVGCVAAYCAFFKTTTKNLRVRIIQGELLDFKGYLLPFADVPQTDRAWRAVQQVCATGLLKGYPQQSGKSLSLNFLPDTTINTDELKPVLTEIYTRAFLWFGKEKPAEKFTVGNLLSFISELTLTDPQLLQAEMQKAWKTQYKFRLDFDVKRPVTRREFVVLANKFLNPFARTVNLEGKLVN